MPRRPTCVALLTRVRAQDGTTLHFTMPAKTQRRRCPLEFLEPANVPEFEGEQAWFELERVSARPWAYWRAVRRVDPPAWAAS